MKLLARTLMALLFATAFIAGCSKNEPTQTGENMATDTTNQAKSAEPAPAEAMPKEAEKSEPGGWVPPAE